MATPNPSDHPLWPAFLAWLDEWPEWSVIRQWSDNHLASIWTIFLAGVEAENKRMLECT